MLVSNIDQLPGQVVSPKVEIELTTERDIYVTLPNIIVSYQ